MDRHFPKAALQRFNRNILGALLLCCAIPVYSDADSAPLHALQPVTAEYTVNIKGMNARLERNLKPVSKNRWVVESKSSILFFRIIERSEFEIDGAHLRPLTYLINRTGGGDRNQDVTFDWQRGIASNRHKEEPWEFNLPADKTLLDQLSLQIQLRHDLLQGRLLNGNHYDILDRGRVKTYTIEQLGEETLTLPSGKEVNSVKLKQFREGKDRFTLVWLLPDHHYLIGKLQHHDDGEVTDLVLRRAVIGGNTVE